MADLLEVFELELDLDEDFGSDLVVDLERDAVEERGRILLLLLDFMELFVERIFVGRDFLMLLLEELGRRAIVVELLVLWLWDLELVFGGSFLALEEPLVLETLFDEEDFLLVPVFIFGTVFCFVLILLLGLDEDSTVGLLDFIDPAFGFEVSLRFVEVVLVFGFRVVLDFILPGLRAFLVGL